MARDVRDCAILLEAMAGFDPKDATSLDLPVPAVGSEPLLRSARQEGRHPEGIPPRWFECRDRGAVGRRGSRG
jgi:Asp-tRNA(Asn)/Glu-tRNA(Gln) amidotransferase A subunit family amidase